MTLPDEPGTTIEFQGVQLADLLKYCGVKLGKEVRGPRVASYVLVEATDGYRVLLALAEVDPATTDKIVLLTDTRDKAALGEREGPFRLVIPDDKRPGALDSHDQADQRAPSTRCVIVALALLPAELKRPMKSRRGATSSVSGISPCRFRGRRSRLRAWPNNAVMEK